MIIRFNNAYLENLADSLPVKGKPKYDSHVIAKYKRTLSILEEVETSHELRSFRGLNFEALQGDKKGFYSVRVDYHYRLIFTLEKDILTIEEVITIEDLTNHYS